MPKRGEVAKESVKNTIIEAFSSLKAFVTVQDKKIYVTAKDDNGEILQFAISITMPKTPINVEAPINAPEDAPAAPDRAKVEELKKMLGLLDDTN